MRWILVLVLLLCVWSSWRVWQDRHGEAAVPAVSAASPDAAPDPPAATSWWDRIRKTEPAPDPVVHCRIGDASGFLRSSECRRGGGFPDEPIWARSDPAP